LLLTALLVLIGLLAAGATITLSGGDPSASAQQYPTGGETTGIEPPDPDPGQYGTTGIEPPDPLESGQGEISGRVLDDSGNVLGGAPVYVCRMSGDGGCKDTQTDAASGAYAFSNLPDAEYKLWAYPPPGSSARSAEIGPLELSETQRTLSGQDFELVVPKPIPQDTTITSLYESAGIPVVLPDAQLTLTTQSCAGGTARYDVLQNGQVLDGKSGGMTEDPPGSGTYTATVAPLEVFGTARFVITVDCPDGADETSTFDVYIDPSGNVRTVEGDPIEGARVTLYRSDSEGGPFDVVPDGSDIMSPSNRANPDATDAEGRFGWDVKPGFYKVRAEEEGCASPEDPEQGFFESRVMEIPPPVTDLDLPLDCGGRYDFSGFFAPVDNLPTVNTAKAGRAIPVKFGLGGDQGLDIFAAGYPKSQKYDCETGAPTDQVEETTTAGGSSLTYAATSKLYTYVWKTETAWAGDCRKLVLKPNDHTKHEANFRFAAK
jgi:hypothetical protein